MRTSLPRMLHTCKVRACSPLCAPFAGAYSAAYPVSSIVHSWRPLPPCDPAGIELWLCMAQPVLLQRARVVVSDKLLVDR
jgi:hypothetical protein